MRYVQAVSHGGPMPGRPRLLVVHDAETPLKRGYALSLAVNWFGRAAPTSAHYIVDPGEIVQMLSTQTIGWHCGTGNTRSIGYEQSGYATLSRAEWTTPDGLSQMRLLAGQIAADAALYDIPIRWATSEQIVDGHHGGAGGLATHDDMRRALGGTTHTDPTPNYPRDMLLRMVLDAAAGTVPTATPPVQKEWWEMAKLDPDVAAEIRTLVRQELQYAVGAITGLNNNTVQTVKPQLRDTLARIEANTKPTTDEPEAA